MHNCLTKIKCKNIPEDEGIGKVELLCLNNPFLNILLNVMYKDIYL